MCKAKGRFMNGKKGQAEDIFSDLLVAAIIIAITLVVISINEGVQSSSTSEIISADAKSINDISLINALRTEIQANRESEEGSSIESISIAEIIILASENYEKNPEAAWIFENNELLEGSPGKTAYCSGYLEESLRLITQRSIIKATNPENRIVFQCGESTPQYGESAAPLSVSLKKIIIPDKSGKIITIHQTLPYCKIFGERLKCDKTEEI